MARVRVDLKAVCPYIRLVPNQSALRKPFRYRNYNIAFILIGVNFLIFFLTTLSPNLMRYLAMNPVFVVQGNYWWQVFTYMFVHGGMTHIFFNMIGLFFFGTQVEHRLGSWEFLTFYLTVGTLAGAFSLAFYWFSGSYMVFLVGASGAIFGVLLAFAALYPTAMIYLFGIIPIRAPILVIGYTVIELMSQISGRGGNVAHLTHLAGFLFAFMYFVIRLGINPISVFIDDLRR